MTRAVILWCRIRSCPNSLRIERWAERSRICQEAVTRATEFSGSNIAHVNVPFVGLGSNYFVQTSATIERRRLFLLSPSLDCTDFALAVPWLWALVLFIRQAIRHNHAGFLPSSRCPHSTPCRVGAFPHIRARLYVDILLGSGVQRACGSRVVFMFLGRDTKSTPLSRARTRRNVDTIEVPNSSSISRPSVAADYSNRSQRCTFRVIAHKLDAMVITNRIDCTMGTFYFLCEFKRRYAPCVWGTEPQKCAPSDGSFVTVDSYSGVAFVAAAYRNQLKYTHDAPKNKQ